MIFALLFSDFLDTLCGDHDSSKAYFNRYKELYSRFGGRFFYAGKFNGKPYYKFGRIFFAGIRVTSNKKYKAI